MTPKIGWRTTTPTARSTPPKSGVPFQHKGVQALPARYGRASRRASVLKDLPTTVGSCTARLRKTIAKADDGTTDVCLKTPHCERWRDGWEFWYPPCTHDYPVDVGANICGKGPLDLGITANIFDRSNCGQDEKMDGGLCYPDPHPGFECFLTYCSSGDRIGTSGPPTECDDEWELRDNGFGQKRCSFVELTQVTKTKKGPHMARGMNAVKLPHRAASTGAGSTRPTMSARSSAPPRASPDVPLRPPLRDRGPRRASAGMTTKNPLGGAHPPFKAPPTSSSCERCGMLSRRRDAALAFEPENHGAS